MQVSEAPVFQPPGGNMPVLVLQGGFYPTPRAWAESATANMTGTQFVDILDAAPLAYLNGPGSNCGVNLAQAFLIDPEAELDTACASEPLDTTWITFR
jgi:predicted membrane protein